MPRVCPRLHRGEGGALRQGAPAPAAAARTATAATATAVAATTAAACDADVDGLHPRVQRQEDLAPLARPEKEGGMFFIAQGGAHSGKWGRVPNLKLHL
jgi:hypothetical protein